MQRKDLAGVYITDDHIDVIVGSDANPNKNKSSISGLTLNFDTSGSGDDDDDVNRFTFEKGEPPERLIDEVCQWIAEKTSCDLRSLAIGIYGPFFSLSRRDRDEKSPDYGRLQPTARGRFSAKPLAKLFQDGLAAHGVTGALLTIETDVAAAAIGEVYNRSLKDDGTRDVSFDDKVIVFVKASIGIGAAFIRASASWRGRLHTEMGQFYVPVWRSGEADIDYQEAKFRFEGALNPGSLESLASVPAINARFKPMRFDQLKKKPDHYAWDREAWYLAHMMWTLTCVVSPHAIVVGGRIMAVPGLVEKVRTAFGKIYEQGLMPTYPELRELESYITRDTEHWANQSGRPGIVGALCIAAMERQSRQG